MFLGFNVLSAAQGHPRTHNNNYEDDNHNDDDDNGEESEEETPLDHKETVVCT